MHTRTLTYIVSVGGFALTALAATPETRRPNEVPPSGGTVTLPLSDLRTLWEKSQPEQKEPAPQHWQPLGEPGCQRRCNHHSGGG